MTAESGHPPGPSEVVQSEVVPLEPGQSEPLPLEPLRRNAARVIVLDSADRVLLLEGRDSTRPEAGSWWITPGGGTDEGESLEDCARRELREETGLVIGSGPVGELGAIAMRRTVRFPFEQYDIEQAEVFFVVRVAAAAPAIDRAEWTDVEQRTLLRHRWWSRAELLATGETVYPEGLSDLLET